MKYWTPILAIAVATASSTAIAEHTSSGAFYDYGRVKHVEPVVEYVEVRTPHQECHTRQEVRYDNRYDDSATSTILGAIIGGAVAHKLTKKRHRNAMTVAGTILGGSIGRDYSNKHRNRGHGRRVNYQECDDTYRVSQREEIVGYDVTYKYKGRTFQTRTEYDPGDKIRVQVSVQPAVNNDLYSRL